MAESENKELKDPIEAINDLRCQVLDSIKRKGKDHPDTLELSGKLNRLVLRIAIDQNVNNLKQQQEAISSETQEK